MNGTSFGIPWYVETRLVYYRTDLAKKAGYTTPPTDWAGAEGDGQGHADQGRRQVGHRPPGRRHRARGRPSCRSRGPTAPNLTKDGGKAYNFDTPEMLEAVKYYQSYFTDGISDKAAPATPTTEPDFVSGKVPMFISGPWEMSARREGRRRRLQGQVRRHA